MQLEPQSESLHIFQIFTGLSALRRTTLTLFVTEHNVFSV